MGKAFLQIAKVQGRPSSPNLGQTVEAVENYRKGIEILEPILLNSTDTVWQSNLISAYSDYAVVLKQNGNFSESEKTFQKAISNGELFLARNPNNPTLAFRLAAAYMFWAESLPFGTNEDENINTFKKSLTIFEGLIKDKPDDLLLNNYAIVTRLSQAKSLIYLAKSARFDENQTLEKQHLSEAKSLVEKSLEISEKLVKMNPNQILPLALSASVELDYATLLIELEDYSKALEFTQKAEKFYRKSMEMDSVSVGQKIEVSTVEQKLGIIYSRTGNSAKAEPLFKHALELLDYLVEKDSENFDYVKVRGEAKFDYADELLRRGEIEKARQTYENTFNEMLEISNKKDSAFAVSLHGLFYEKLGNCYLAESKKDKAMAAYQKAAGIWKKDGVLNIAGNKQNDKLTILEKKINHLKN